LKNDKVRTELNKINEIKTKLKKLTKTKTELNKKHMRMILKKIFKKKHEITYNSDELYSINNLKVVTKIN